MNCSCSSLCPSSSPSLCSYPSPVHPPLPIYFLSPCSSPSPCESPSLCTSYGPSPHTLYGPALPCSPSMISDPLLQPFSPYYFPYRSIFTLKLSVCGTPVALKLCCWAWSQTNAEPYCRTTSLERPVLLEACAMLRSVADEGPQSLG